MERAIRDVLANHAKLSVDVADVERSADLYAAGLTSHGSVNLMLGLEEAFGVEFSDEMLRKSTFSSIASIEEALRRLGADG